MDFLKQEWQNIEPPRRYALYFVCGLVVLAMMPNGAVGVVIVLAACVGLFFAYAALHYARREGLSWHEALAYMMYTTYGFVPIDSTCREKEVSHPDCVAQAAVQLYEFVRHIIPDARNGDCYMWSCATYELHVRPSRHVYDCLVVTRLVAPNGVVVTALKRALRVDMTQRVAVLYAGTLEDCESPGVYPLTSIEQLPERHVFNRLMVGATVDTDLCAQELQDCIEYISQGDRTR